MKRLIVSADDFGLSKGINEGIVKAYRDGIVSSINFIPTGSVFDDAVDLAKELGIKEAGAHLALTQTRPLSGSTDIPTLIRPGGSFYKGHVNFFIKYIWGTFDFDQVYLELKRQMDRIFSTKIAITNLSGHEHIHMVPQVLEIFVKLAREYDISVIRYPHNDRSYNPGFRKFYKGAVLAYFQHRAGEIIRSAGIRYPEHFCGLLDSGRISEDTMIKIIGSLEDGTTELVCHPGVVDSEIVNNYIFHKNCESELSALLSPHVKDRIAEDNIDVISYGEFLSSK